MRKKETNTLGEMRDRFRRVFGSKEGQMVLAHITTMAGVIEKTYQPGMTAIDMAHNEGRRSVGVDIYKMMEE